LQPPARQDEPLPAHPNRAKEKALKARGEQQLRTTLWRVAGFKGGRVAVFATARQLARLVYRMLRHGHDYVDIGETAYERRFQARRLLAITETARSLGYTLIPTAGAA
jgi:hypothetical protein